VGDGRGFGPWSLVGVAVVTALAPPRFDWSEGPSHVETGGRQPRGTTHRGPRRSSPTTTCSDDAPGSVPLLVQLRGRAGYGAGRDPDTPARAATRHLPGPDGAATTRRVRAVADNRRPDDRPAQLLQTTGEPPSTDAE
jgi:hypothetical protein